MTDFDYNKYKVVGYVDFTNGNSNSNAKIKVVGYMDWRNNFSYLNEEESANLFSPHGNVFAHNFAEKHYGHKGRLVCISVIPNEKPGDKYDAFIWDKSGVVFEFGKKVKKLNGCFSANGQYNYSLLKENGFLDIDQDTYVSSGGYIYLIKANCQERLISYWRETSINTLAVYGKTFIIDTNKEAEDGRIDITTDEQLIEWYIKNVLKKNWNDIFEQKTFRNVETLIRDAISTSKGLDQTIIESRVKRLSRLNKSFDISIEDLKDLKELPWLHNSIEQSIERNKALYLEEIEKEKAKELKEIRERYDTEILAEKERSEKEKNKFNQQIEDISETYKSKLKEFEKLLHDKHHETELLEESYQAKKKEISALEDVIGRLEERKEEIIKDFSVVKDVLGTHRSAKSNSQYIAYSMEELNLADTPFPVYQAYIKSIENTLKANEIPHANSSLIGERLKDYYTLLVPDAAIAKVIIMASMKCCYMVEYVSATWKSFADLWDNGLGCIIEECNKNEGLMHFLILQNINLTYLPNYMMPLIDMQKGVITKFPGTGMSFPQNLRILCTRTSDEVMPLSEDCLQYIGCIDDNFEKEHYGIIIPPENTNLGYLTPQVLAKADDLNNDLLMILNGK